MATKTITAFDKSNLGDIRKAIDTALTAALGKFGLSGQLGKIRFQDTEFTASVTVSTKNNGQTQFTKSASLFKLKPEWFGQKLTGKGGLVYTITGLDMGRSKYPVVATATDGTITCFTAEAARMQLGDEQTVLNERANEARRDYEYGAMFDHSPLNLAWLGQEVAVGKERLTVAGKIQRGRTSYVIFVGGKMLREVDFLSVLKLPENKRVHDLPKLSFKDYNLAKTASAATAAA